LWNNEQTTITIFLNKMSQFFFLSPVWIHKLLKLVNEEKLKPVILQATKQGSKRKRDEQDQQEEKEEEEEEEDVVATIDPQRVALKKSDEEAEKEQHDEDADADDARSHIYTNLAIRQHLTQVIKVRRKHSERLLYSEVYGGAGGCRRMQNPLLVEPQMH